MQYERMVRADIETLDTVLVPDDEAVSTPGLDVSLMVGVAPIATPCGHVALVNLGGGLAPVRVSLYIDGDLVDSWMPAPATCELPLPTLLPGRHAVTVRAIDASGRWGAASGIVSV